MVGGRFFGHYFHQITGAARGDRRAELAARFYSARAPAVLPRSPIPALIFLGLAIGHDAVMRAAGKLDPDYASVVSWLDAHDVSRTASLCIVGQRSPVLYFDADQSARLSLRVRELPDRLVASDAVADRSDHGLVEEHRAAGVGHARRPISPARQPMFIVDGSPSNVGFYAKYPPEAFPRLAKIP